MTRLFMTACAAMLVFTLFGAGSVSAHAGLIRCSIHNGQVFRAGHTPRSVQAYFAEPLEPTRSFIAIFENQADHGLVTEKQHSTVNFQKPTEMTLPLPRIARGRYYLLWYTHSAADNHFAAGVVYFQVR